jgi:hypothetical protein
MTSSVDKRIHFVYVYVGLNFNQRDVIGVFTVGDLKIGDEKERFGLFVVDW